MRPGVKREIDSRPKQRLITDFGPQAQEFLTRYMDMRNGVDTTFGIRHDNDVWFIGNKQILHFKKKNVQPCRHDYVIVKIYRHNT